MEEQKDLGPTGNLFEQWKGKTIHMDGKYWEVTGAGTQDEPSLMLIEKAPEGSPKAIRTVPLKDIEALQE